MKDGDLLVASLRAKAYFTSHGEELMKRYRIICPKHPTPVTTYSNEPVCKTGGRPADVVIPRV